MTFYTLLELNESLLLVNRLTFMLHSLIELLMAEDIGVLAVFNPLSGDLIVAGILFRLLS